MHAGCQIVFTTILYYVFDISGRVHLVKKTTTSKKKAKITSILQHLCTTSPDMQYNYA